MFGEERQKQRTYGEKQQPGDQKEGMKFARIAGQSLVPETRKRVEFWGYHIFFEERRNSKAEQPG